MHLKAAIEALLFASSGVSPEKLAKVLETSEEKVKEILKELVKEYEKPEHGVVLREVGGKYRFYTKPEYADLVSRMSRRKYRNLTESQMEIVALLLLSGPLPKSEIDAFRGKDSSNVLSSLQKMGVVRKKRHGRGFLYQLSPSFVESAMLDEMLKEVSQKLGGDGGQP
ncbi:MAG: Condensin subunit ScpB [Thermotoga sp. 47_83]|jgi:segregation and condensation protein B|uniref:Chromosome segregation and condensation protein, ScpB n=2 Tax=Thermotoga petrophila TaxID=93929 RepID=D2C5Z4_THEP2|nr:SMC-Scp complex subunit ScpB [Thermotoga petrophila]KUK33226.1 MAG: Condensin subunit ScpB [Thermotoga sp. 47_83]ADA66380.1 chromosome segregation and condensation protein, ScpB [Thermotoga petrophila RKU-10]KUK22418.1 MAG: Condensin subunit ScpB [Thermotoga petrophila]HAA81892.1 SMC-Scp complex subunit ScpB [Thermotoga petrophila]HBU00518.1 SMC-Scp complex subunit ScpB [Thermotoga petrophila]